MRGIIGGRLENWQSGKEWVLILLFVVEEAGLHTVLSLHPFPPFPADVREPSVDVHVDFPGTKR